MIGALVLILVLTVGVFAAFFLGDDDGPGDAAGPWGWP